MDDHVFEKAHAKISADFVASLIPGGNWERPDDYYCLNPLRNDQHIKSFHIYVSSDSGKWVFYDFAGGMKGDVIELCSRMWVCEPLEAAKKLAGDESLPEVTRSYLDVPKKRGRPETPKPIAVDFDEATKKIFTRNRIIEIALMMKTRPCEAHMGPAGKYVFEPGSSIVAFWWYRNAEGLVDGLDVRFEKEIEDEKSSERRLAESDQKGTGSRGIDPENENPNVGLGHLQPRTRQKFVITYWWDGTSVRTSPAPVLVFGRENLANYPGKTVLIHEGAKCAAIAQEALPEFVHIAWSGGAQKAKSVDWTPLAGRTAIVYPDADDPGSGAARTIREKLTAGGISCQIRQPLEQAVDKFGPGADIVEALAVATPAELTKYLKNGPELEVSQDDLRNPRRSPDVVRSSRQDHENERGPDSEETGGIPGSGIPFGNGSGEGETQSEETGGSDPFRILGVADDGLAYFLDQWGRLQKWRLESLSTEKLRILADFNFWFRNYSHAGKMGKLQWQIAVEDLTQMTGKLDFDPESIRGRGAWKEPDGRICFHDGETTIGEWDRKRLYIRRTKHDIGLGDEPAGREVRKEMLMAAADLSFETRADCVRLLAWSVLAPFCGALPWRPTGFITGKSQSGKTTALNLIVRKLSGAETCSGAESSAAGIRQHNRADAIGIIIEEAEDDTEKKKMNRDEQLAYARQCTSDDAPQAWKGTLDGQGIKFGSEKMFLFAAISPMVDSSADQNRIFTVAMVQDPESKPEEWAKKETRVKLAFSDENCRAVRAYTWQRLKEIIAYAKVMTNLVHNKSGHSTRYSYLEAILFSAYWIVFQGRIPKEEEAFEFLATRYKEHAPEQIMDEAETMVERLMNEAVQIVGDFKDKASIGKILHVIAESLNAKDWRLEQPDRENPSNELLDRYKATADLHGFYVLPTTGELAVYVRQPFIAKTLRTGRDYHKMLKRHPAYATEKAVKPSGGITHTAVIFKPEIIETDPPF